MSGFERKCCWRYLAGGHPRGVHGGGLGHRGTQSVKQITRTPEQDRHQQRGKHRFKVAAFNCICKNFTKITKITKSKSNFTKKGACLTVGIDLIEKSALGGESNMFHKSATSMAMEMNVPWKIEKETPKK